MYAFVVVFVIVDITVHTKNYYNLVSLSGIAVYLSITFLFSTAPRKASIYATVTFIASSIAYSLAFNV